MKAKSLLSSKTFWFNILFVIVAIAGLFGFNDFQPDAKVVEGVGALVLIGNIILRLFTSKPINKVV